MRQATCLSLISSVPDFLLISYFLAGGGVKSGFVPGTSDAQAAYPKDHPVSPGDLCATIYHLLGIDPGTMLPDSTNRPHSITHGGLPVEEILG